jgi:hypothetical protein
MMKIRKSTEAGTPSSQATTYPTAPSCLSRNRSYQFVITPSSAHYRKSNAARIDRRDTADEIYNRGMDAPERYEQLIAYLNSNLPEPVEQLDSDDGALQFLAGDPPQVVAVLTDTSVSVSEFAGVWESPFKFTAKPRRVGMLKWRRLPENALLAALSALIKGARETRLASFQACDYCGLRTPPESLHDTGVCQSCTDRHSGAIH